MSKMEEEVNFPGAWKVKCGCTRRRRDEVKGEGERDDQREEGVW